MTKVTVLMSVYNSKLYLHEAVESILNQTYQDFEFLIIDDCSQDGCRQVLEEYARQDDRIRLLVNTRNRGLGYSLKRGISEARGEWIARMDSDDISYPDRLKMQIKWLENHPEIDILGAQAVDIDNNGRFIRERRVPLTHEEIRRTLPYANPVIHPTVIFRRASILSVGSYRADLRYLQDYDLWFRCMARGLQFANLPEVLLGYRVDDNYYRKKSWNYRKVDFQIRKNGCTRIGCKGIEWVGILIPLFLGLIPTSLAPWIYSFAKRIDPRQHHVLYR